MDNASLHQELRRHEVWSVWAAGASGRGFNDILCGGCRSVLLEGVPRDAAYRVGPRALEDHRKGIRDAWAAANPGSNE